MFTLPEDLVSVLKPSMALEKGLLFLLLKVGVVMDPRPPSARLLTLVVLPRRFQPASGLNEVVCGEAAMMAPRYCSASKLEVTSLD